MGQSELDKPHITLENEADAWDACCEITPAVVADANILANTLLVELVELAPVTLAGVVLKHVAADAGAGAGGGESPIAFSANSELCTDKPGDTAVEEGVRGGGGGEETTTFMTFAFPSLPMARVCALALSSAKASQNALCVMKLSLLENKVPQSHLYSLVPQVFM